MKRMFELRVDLDYLKQQINDLLESNCKEESKAGIHHLLGDIRDQIEDVLNV